MKKTIFFKIFSGYLLIAIGLACLVLFFSFRTIKHYYINTLNTDLQDLCRAITPQTLGYIKAGNIKALDQFIKQLDIQTHKRITVIDVTGHVIADSENDPATMANHKSRPEVLVALSGKTGSSIRYSSTIRKDMLYVAMPLYDKDKLTGVLRTSMFLKDINMLLNRMMLHIASITFLVLAFSLFAAFIFSKNLSVPISKLKEASKKIAGGDFNVRVFVQSEGELKELADNFNMMSAKIGSLFGELTRKKEELAAIVNSITEGLVVVDSNDKIKIANESFKKISGLIDMEGRFYWEILRAQGFKELMAKAKEEHGICINEIEFFDKVYTCTVIPLAPGNEYVAVLHDITQRKHLENKKKEFVANVSHELRTPLTAIKGFAETLGVETSKEGRRYLDIIKKHSERLVNIVEDLLHLSKLEENGNEKSFENIGLENLIMDVLKLFKQRSEEKNIIIKIDVQKDLSDIKGDAFRLEQLFVNLIDNALKYTDKGEITVSIKQDNKQTIITVTDTGIGIQKEDLGQIFERFYVVDKSRSKKLGGTGLGLAIVKHIVLLHNGTINVESELGKGTKFTVVLPLLS